MSCKDTRQSVNQLYLLMTLKKILVLYVYTFSVLLLKNYADDGNTSRTISKHPQHLIAQTGKKPEASVCFCRLTLLADSVSVVRIRIKHITRTHSVTSQLHCQPSRPPFVVQN